MHKLYCTRKCIARVDKETFIHTLLEVMTLYVFHNLDVILENRLLE